MNWQTKIMQQVHWATINEALDQGTIDGSPLDRLKVYEHSLNQITPTDILWERKWKRASDQVRLAIERHEAKQRHEEHGGRFQNIEQDMAGMRMDVANIHIIAARPAWKTWAFWISIISASIAVLALVVSWLAWKRPVAAANGLPMKTVPDLIATGATQLQQQPHPKLKPTNTGSLLRPTNSVP